eukprot:12014549-Prorocentrum_lima.AAC.1
MVGPAEKEAQLTLRKVIRKNQGAVAGRKEDGLKCFKEGNKAATPPVERKSTRLEEKIEELRHLRGQAWR